MSKDSQTTAVDGVQIDSQMFRQGNVSFLSSYGVDGTSFTEPPPM